MYCKRCGNKMEEGEMFCRKCGTKATIYPPAPGPKIPGALEKLRNFRSQGSGVHDWLKIGIIVISILIIASTTLPCYKFNKLISELADVDSLSMINFGGERFMGIIIIVFMGLVILFVCLRWKIPALISSILNLALYSAVIFNYNQYLEEENITEFMSKSTGYYLIPVFAIIQVAAIILYIRQKELPVKINLGNM